MASSPPQAEQTSADYELPDGRCVSWIALTRMLLALSPTRCPDIATVGRVFGDAKFKSIGQIAEAFQVSPTTVRKDWRSMGMPGDPSTGWPVDELFRWHLDRIENRNN